MWSATHLVFCSQLKQVMSWLVAHAPPAIPLSCQTLQQLVEATLNHEFISRVYIEHQKRITAQLPSVHPSPVITLYNAVLTHIADNVTSQEMETLPPCEFWQPENPEFVPYLGWNFVHHQAWIRKAILSLQLPQWESLSATGQWLTTNTTKSQFMVLWSNKNVKPQNPSVNHLCSLSLLLAYWRLMDRTLHFHLWLCCPGATHRPQSTASNVTA